MMDWSNTTTTTTTASVTGESIIEACRKMQAMMDAIPKPDVDVMLMTTDTFNRLRKEVNRDTGPKFDLPIGDAMFDRIAGLPIEHYPTKAECMLRALELRDEGKRVGMCE